MAIPSPGVPEIPEILTEPVEVGLKTYPDTTNVLTGKEAVNCCRSGKLRAYQRVYEAINEAINILEGVRSGFDPDKPESLEDKLKRLTEQQFGISGFVSFKGPTGEILSPEQFKVRFVPANSVPGSTNIRIQGVGEFPGIGNAVAGVGVVLGFYALSGMISSISTLDGANFAAEMISTLVGTQEQYERSVQRGTKKGIDDCEECVRKKLLSQKNPRKWMTEKERNRIRESISSPVTTAG